MSQTTGTNTNNQLTVNTDTSKIFIGENYHDTFTYENDSYDDVSYKAGTVFGQIGSTGLVVPLTSAASDGSQYPIGILAHDIDVEAGDTLTVTLCVKGCVAEGKVLLQDSDTLDTVVEDRTIRARIGADTVGVKLVASTEMTAYDND